MNTRQTASEPLPASDLFVLGVRVADIDLCWFAFTAAYDGCIHHAVRPDGKTFCGRKTTHAEFGGRTLGDDHGDGSNKPAWPSCLKCAASLRKHGLSAPWDRTNADSTT